MANHRYSEQFKRDAVRLVIEEGYSANKAGDAVGVCHTTIGNWVDRTPAVVAARGDVRLARFERE